ncbi:MAG: sugar phosphate nucleotidyltransferase [Chloroflexi bacterium]|nr:sugar phosphate nucleotidyltransferase [Chloroflexota bacterium]
MRQHSNEDPDRSQQVHCALILAGGSGTRLWPMSRTERPKQLLAITEGRSLFRASIERLLPIVAGEQIFVVAGKQQLPALREEVPFLPAENFIGEPSGKNTAPATLLGMAVISALHPQATLSILPADHHIRDEAGFRSALLAAVELAQSTAGGQIITLGIQPTFPAIGFGYLQLGPKLGEKSGFAYHPVLQFVEKPVAERARQYYESGAYRWNAGMFVWPLARAWSEFQRAQPEATALFRQLSQEYERGGEIDLTAAWARVEALPLDIAVMEQAADMWVIPVELGWSDVGSWSSVFDVLPRDEAGNHGKTLDENGKVQFTASRDTLILSETAKHIVALGVKDLVIIETDEALLVCHRERAQEVRSIVKQLSLNG